MIGSGWAFFAPITFQCVHLTSGLSLRRDIDLPDASFQPELDWPRPRPELNASFREAWLSRHDLDVSALYASCQGPHGTQLRGALLGDSITEAWRRPTFSSHVVKPLDYEVPWPSDARVEAVFGKHVGVAAIGGDKIPDLGWRIENGLGQALSTCRPHRLHVLVGTNDLGHERPMADIFQDLHKLVRGLQRRLDNRTSLILQALMPRAAFEKASECGCGGFTQQAAAMPPSLRWASCPEAKHEPPLRRDHRPECSEFFPMVTAFNEHLHSLVETFRSSAHGLRDIEFLDCTENFLDERGRLSKESFPDFLHPNVAGYKGWRDCLRNGHGGRGIDRF